MGSLASGVFGQLTLVLSGPVTARLLGVAGRGELALLTIIAAIGGVVGAAGLPTAVAFAMSSQGVSTALIARTLARVWWRLCLAAGTLSALAVVLVLHRSSTSPVWLEALLVGWTVVAMMTAQLILGCIQGERRFTLLNLLRPVGSTISALALACIFLAVRHSGPAPVMGVLLAASVATCVLGGAFLATSWRPTVAPARSTVSAATLLRYGLASLAGGSAPLESLSLDQAAVGFFLSREQLGLYAVGGAFANLSATLVTGIGMVALPRIAGAPTHHSRRALMRRTALVSTAAAAGAAVFAEGIVGWLLPLAFGSAFSGAVAVARVLIVAGFALGVRRILVVFLQALGQPGQTGVGEGIALLALVGLAAVLTPIFGLIGASASLLGAAVVASIYLLWIIKRYDAILASTAR